MRTRKAWPPSNSIIREYNAHTRQVHPGPVLHIGQLWQCFKLFVCHKSCVDHWRRPNLQRHYLCGKCNGTRRRGNYRLVVRKLNHEFIFLLPCGKSRPRLMKIYNQHFGLATPNIHRVPVDGKHPKTPDRSRNVLK